MNRLLTLAVLTAALPTRSHDLELLGLVNRGV